MSRAPAPTDLPRNTARSAGQALIRRAFKVLTRAAVEPASTGGWGAELGADGVAAFVASLSPTSAGARLIGAGIPMPLARHKSLTLPRRSGSKAAANSAFWTLEGAGTPAIQYAMTGATLGPPTKLDVITVMSQELADQSGAEQIFGALLREDVSATLDAAMFSTSDASGAVPRGLLYNVTPLAADDGTNGPLAAVIADLSDLAGSIADAGGNVVNVAYIAAPRQATAANLWLANRNVSVWPCAALDDGTVVAVETTAFVSGFGPEPTITTADETPIILSDPVAPFSVEGSPTAIMPFPIVSCFQANLRAIRLSLDVAYTMRAEGRVAVVGGVTWGGAPT